MYNHRQWEFHWPIPMAAIVRELGLTIAAVEAMYEATDSIRIKSGPDTIEVIGYARPSRPLRLVVQLEDGPSARLLHVTAVEILTPDDVASATQAAGR
jgi:hypothetical protein